MCVVLHFLCVYIHTHIHILILIFLFIVITRLDVSACMYMYLFPGFVHSHKISHNERLMRKNVAFI